LADLAGHPISVFRTADRVPTENKDVPFRLKGIGFQRRVLGFWLTRQRIGRGVDERIDAALAREFAVPVHGHEHAAASLVA